MKLARQIHERCSRSPAQKIIQNEDGPFVITYSHRGKPLGRADLGRFGNPNTEGRHAQGVHPQRMSVLVGAFPRTSCCSPVARVPRDRALYSPKYFDDLQLSTKRDGATVGFPSLDPSGVRVWVCIVIPAAVLASRPRTICALLAENKRHAHEVSRRVPLQDSTTEHGEAPSLSSITPFSVNRILGPSSDAVPLPPRASGPRVTCLGSACPAPAR